MRFALLAVLVLEASVVAGAQARQVPVRKLKSVGSFGTDLSEVTGVAELKDGRVLISDIRERTLRVVDMARGTATQVGRAGEGPNEYKHPGGLYVGMGDTLYLFDRSQPRLLLVTQEGKIVGMKSTERRGTRESSDGGQDSKRVDQAGRVLHEGSPFGLRPRSNAGGAAPDSNALLRFDPASQKEDTIAQLRIPPAEVKRNGPMVMSRSTIFGPRDVWALSPSGRIALVRAEPYRVEYLDAERRVVGPELPVTRVPVEDADKKVFAAANEGVSLGRTRGGERTKLEQIPIPKEVSFAEYKPPVSNEYMPLFAPDGRLWIWRHQKYGASSTVYDVVDAKGALVEQVEFPARTRVMGFGPKAVYAVVLDDDDVPALHKFQLSPK